MAREYRCSYDFKYPREIVWSYASNTDRLNRAGGAPPIEYVQVADPNGTFKRFGSFRIFGIKIKWQELPFDWVTPQHYEVERIYNSLFLKKAIIRFEFEPTPAGCRINLIVHYEPGLLFFAPLLDFAFRSFVRSKFNAAFDHITDFLDKKTDKPFQDTRPDKVEPSQQTLSFLRKKLEESGASRSLQDKLIDHIYTSQELDLFRVRPLRLGKKWQIEPLEIVSVFLRATRSGVFTLSWDLICPNCRGSKGGFASLSSLDSIVHCESCNIRFDAKFDRSVELSFHPSPWVRLVQLAQYCAGGPNNTPHYIAQLRIPKKESREFEVDLKEGVYRFRNSLWDSGGLFLNVVRDGTSSKQPILVDPKLREINIPEGSHRFQIQNPKDQEALLVLERTEWLEDICTASYVTALQEFRDLFSTEVLRPGQEIEVGAVALLFTDLKGSTSMYHRIGDATAFNLVQDHFEILIDCVKSNEGGLVKTIGDAVMASFSNPENAVKAAMDIHRRIAEHNDRSELQEKLKVKVGIHYGPCLIVNQNEKLDYFGSSVNIAARTESQCEGGDIVITAQTMKAYEVADIIKKSGFPVNQTFRPLKGFDENFELYRIECIPKNR